MLRNILSLIIILAMAAAAVWLADHPGAIEIEWIGYEIRTSAAFLLLLLLVTIGSLWIILRLISSILQLPGRFTRGRELSHQRQGLTALTEAFIAIGERNLDEAQKQISRAERTLPDPTLPRLLQLQLMKQKDEREQIAGQLRLLQKSPQTKPLALRGLIEEARRFARINEALPYAEELLKLKPRNAYSLKTAIGLYSYKRRWQEAEKLAKRASRYNVIPKDEINRLLASLYTEQALAMLEERNRHSAINQLQAALRRDPGLTKAASELASLYLHAGKKRQARNIIQKAWAHHAHPKLGESYLKLYEEQTDTQKLQRVRDLAKQNPDALESHFLVARAAMRAKEYAIARNHLKSALSKQETVTVCKLMAELETLENQDENSAKNWLEKAATAAPDPSWQCEHCGHRPESWQAHCDQCHYFGSISWKLPQPAALPANT